MTAKAVTDEQLGKFSRRTRELQERLEKGTIPFDGTMIGLQKLMESSAVQEPNAESDYRRILHRQMLKLIKLRAFNDMGISERLYRSSLLEAITAFSWSREFADIDLREIALVDYRIPMLTLAKAQGIYYGLLSPALCVNYEGINVPKDRPLVIQGQWGQLYQGKSADWCRNQHKDKEQPLTLKEALTVCYYNGSPLIERCGIIASGSYAKTSWYRKESRLAPILTLEVCTITLDSIDDHKSGQNYGPATRGITS
mgnify:CR=1 FL=1